MVGVRTFDRSGVSSTLCRLSFLTMNLLGSKAIRYVGSISRSTIPSPGLAALVKADEACVQLSPQFRFRKSVTRKASDQRSYSTQVHQAFGNDHVVYSSVRRLSSVGISAIAAIQTGFWGSATCVATVIPEPMISPLLLVGGTALSMAFAGMVHIYLSRSVAKLSVLGVSGVKIAVTTYTFGGFLRTPRIIDTATLVGGPKRAAETERYWTFGVQPAENSFVRYFVIDRRAGILDEEAVRAICSTPRGGSLLTVLAYKRQATEMKSRWQNWEQSKSR